jgi:hypothetical protein
MGVLISWFVVRDLIMGRRRHDKSGMGQQSN